jgi:hypothetical protein
MSEIRKTLIFGAVAVVLALAAWAGSPKSVTPDAFLDQGEQFFPEFTDPNAATGLEVVEFDTETAEAIPFKVTNQNGRWSIPSHHDYPADGEDRLASTAAGVIGIRKDDFRTGNVADHEACGVIDPIDEGATSLKGRGKRVTLRGTNDLVLADFIVGEELQDRSGFRFVRIPEQKRVYVARMNIDISTKFQDWIDKDLLRVEQSAIDHLVLRDYSIDERTQRVSQRDHLILDKVDGAWKANRMTAGQEIDTVKMDDLLGAVDELSIVGVRPKPEGISQGLKRSGGKLNITQANLLLLQAKGYYFSRDGGLLSNDGELQVRTTDGVTYTLRFGEIVYGMGEAVTAGTDSSDDADSGPGENRYLFITTSFHADMFPEPKKPLNEDFQNKAEDEWTDADRRNKSLYDAHEEWRGNVEKGQSISRELNDRFADWYYVISADSFDKIRIKRADLVVKSETS